MRSTPEAVHVSDAPSATGTGGQTANAEFVHEATVGCGRLVIRPLAAADVTGVCVVMTRAFATTDEDITLQNATGYIKGYLTQSHDKGMLLVARLFPTDPLLLPPNQSSRIVGLVALSFHPDTMQPCPSLPPPPGIAYLSNMAVDSKLRRQGIARALLAAAAQATLTTSAALLPSTVPLRRELYLHVKQSDIAPQALYTSEGYQEVARDSIMVKFKGIKPRILMRKVLLADKGPS